MTSANMTFLTCILVFTWSAAVICVLILLCGNLTKHETKRVGVVAILTLVGAFFVTHLTIEKAQNARKLDHKYNRIVLR